MKKEQGFSLIELLIVVAIIAIIAAIAVPSMLTSRMAANEASAIQGCRTIGSAEVAYAAVNNQAFEDELQKLVDGGFLDQRYGDTSAGFNGYKYEAGKVDGGPETQTAPDGFGFIASPTAGGNTGRYKYGIAQDLVVRYQGKAEGYTGDDPAGMTEGDPIGKVAASGGGGEESGGGESGGGS